MSASAGTNADPSRDAVAVTHVPTKRDVLAAHRRLIRRRALRMAALWVVVFVAAVLVTMALDGRGLDIGPAVAVGVAGVLAVFPVVYGLSLVLVRLSVARRAKAQFKGYSAAYRVVFDARGVRVASEAGDEDTPWAGYSAWDEDARTVYFHRAGAVAGFLPKRVLSPEDLARVRGFAHAAGVPGCPPA